MKLIWTLCLGFLAASPALAQVRVVSELVLPSVPAVVPTVGFSPQSALPSLGLTLPSVQASGPAPTPAPMPHLAPSPEAQSARSALVGTGAALAIAVNERRDQDPVSRQAFDAAGPREDRAASPAVSATAAPEVSADHVHALRFSTKEPRRQKLINNGLEGLEVAALALPLAWGSLMIHAWLDHGATMSIATLLLWSLGFLLMRKHLAQMRSTVVGGWQASHDQKYRTSYQTGELIDIRGKKYGEDRYEQHADGRVGRTATALMGLLAAGAAAFFLLL